MHARMFYKCFNIINIGNAGGRAAPLTFLERGDRDRASPPPPGGDAPAFS